MKKLILLFVVVLLAGCAGTFQPPEVCDDSDSLILQRLEDPRALDKTLMTVQLAALEKIEHYTAKDALLLLSTIEEKVDTLQTYTDVVVYLIQKLKIANSLAGASLFIIGDDLATLQADVPITDCDRALIKKHIAKQRMLAAFY